MYKLFTPKSYEINFKDLGELALRQVSSEELKELRAYSGFEFLQDSIVICRIVNYERPGFIYNPDKTKLKGTIMYLESLTKLQLLCFLQVMNIYIAMEFDTL